MPRFPVRLSVVAAIAVTSTSAMVLNRYFHKSSNSIDDNASRIANSRATLDNIAWWSNIVAQCDNATANSKANSKASSFFSFFTSVAKKDPISFATYNANNPIEDRYIAFEDPKTNTLIGAVLDGHGGWNVADFVSKLLVPKVQESLLEGGNNDILANEEEVERKLVNIFTDLEESYKKSIRSAFDLGFGEVAKVGSCVVLAIVNGKRAVIANAGDCRAILASKSHQNDKEKDKSKLDIFATRITRDHNCRELQELIVLQQEHPGENDVVVCKNSHACYVKGRLQLTRAIGDLYLKDRYFNAPANSHRKLGRHIPEPYTPPYVKYIPDIHHIKIDEKDKFILLASDGVWDFLSDQQAVEIVEKSRLSSPSSKDAANALVEAALTAAARNHNMTLSQLKALPEGDRRRHKHDDTTAVVIWL